MRHWMRWRLAKLRVKGGSTGPDVEGFEFEWGCVDENPRMKWYTVRLWFEFMPDYKITGWALDFIWKFGSCLQNVCMNGPSQVSQKIWKHHISHVFCLIAVCVLHIFHRCTVINLMYELLFTIPQNLEEQVLWYAMMMMLCPFICSSCYLASIITSVSRWLEEHLLRVLSKLKPVPWVEIFWKMGGFLVKAVFEAPQGHWWIVVITSNICSRGHGFSSSWEMCGLQSFLRFPIVASTHALRLKL